MVLPCGFRHFRDVDNAIKMTLTYCPAPQRALAEEARDMDKQEHHGHLDQRSNDSGKRCIAINTEGSNSHGNCKLKVVARSSEAEGRGSLVAATRQYTDFN